ncbi:MAG: hypothetical protein AAB069_07500, partial [Planctomycetota bacterium]
MKYKLCIMRGLVLLLVCLLSAHLFVSKAFGYQDTLEKVRSTGVLTWGFDAEGGAPYVFHDPAH